MADRRGVRTALRRYDAAQETVDRLWEEALRRAGPEPEEDSEWEAWGRRLEEAARDLGLARARQELRAAEDGLIAALIAWVEAQGDRRLAAELRQIAHLARARRRMVEIARRMAG